jgi:hypothetical protein
MESGRLPTRISHEPGAGGWVTSWSSSHWERTNLAGCKPSQLPVEGFGSWMLALGRLGCEDPKLEGGVGGFDARFHAELGIKSGRAPVVRRGHEQPRRAADRSGRGQGSDAGVRGGMMGYPAAVL